MKQFAYLMMLIFLFFTLSVLSCKNSVSSSTQKINSVQNIDDFNITLIKTNKGPGSVEIGDFNKDGLKDLAYATEDRSVAILLGDGKGKFSPANGSPFFCNQYPNDIAIADINKDGIPDLAIANTEVSMLTVLLGNGKGQFQQALQSPFKVHSKPHTHGVAIADFNSDGNLDLATDNWAHDQVLIIFGDGKGNFSNETFYKVGKRPYQRLRSADVNKDGRPDLITTNLEGNNSTVLLGDGDGKFIEAQGSPFAAGDAPFGLAIGDINGDRNDDLLIADSPTITAESKGNDGLWILIGYGKGNFKTMKGSPFKTGKSPSRLAVGDLNNNGINDVVVTNYNDKSISIFYMTKTGIDKIQTIKVGNRPDGIAIGDLNGDGKNDITLTNYDDNTLMILFHK